LLGFVGVARAARMDVRGMASFMVECGKFGGGELAGMAV
jgi:hypothetical protein